jgi:hypothetical protein
MEHIVDYFVGGIVIAAMAVGFIALISQIINYVNLI